MVKKDLEPLGLSEEQITGVLKQHDEEIGEVNASLQKAQDDLKAEQAKAETQGDTIKELNEALKEYKDADVSGLKQTITDLETKLATQKTEHEAELADRDFQALLKDSITAAHGKDAEKIAKLLDVETLKASKNQKDDIAAAVKALAEDDVTKGMFGETAAQVDHTGNLIGTVTPGPAAQKTDTLRSAIAEHYGVK